MKLSVARACACVAIVALGLLPAHVAAATVSAVVAWGDSYYGELGNGDVGVSAAVVPVDLPAGTTLHQVSAGTAYCVAVDTTGQAWSWGSNGYGQLGDGTTTNTSTPTPVTMPAGIHFSSVVGGGNHAVALDTAGHAWAWGRNVFGELGNGTSTNSTTPVPVSMPSGVTFTVVAAGDDFTLALDSAGRAWAWGYNSDGELGDGGTANSSTPTPVSMPSGVTFTAIAAGSYQSLALDSQGRGWAWGYNASGQLGNGTNSSSHVPVPVHMPKGVTFSSIAGGSDHSLALAGDGTAWAWGNDTEGQLGDGTHSNSNIPVSVRMPSGVRFASVAASPGAYHSLAVDTGGGVWAWGDDADGELGSGASTNSATPLPVNLPTGVTVTAAGAGSYHSIALDSEGRAWTWGDNSEGELGSGVASQRELPVVSAAPVTPGFTQVAAGAADTLALDARGTAWAWGYNGDGELGTGDTQNRAVPTPVSTPAGVTFTTIASGATGYFSLALDTHGHAWAWGDNANGELGNGTTTNSSVPVPVSMPSGVTFTSIAAGYSHALAIDNAGHLWAWGSNESGELGNGGSADSATPTPVSIDSHVTFTAIAAGGQVRTQFFAAGDWSLAVDSLGHLWSWGFNGNGELGNGTTANVSIPVPLTLPVLVTSVAAGADHSLALDQLGNAWAWGHGYWGALGNGMTRDSAVPLPVTMPFGVTFTAIAAGADHCLAIDSTGHVWAWGRNTSGQLGNNTTTGSSVPIAVSTAPGAVFAGIAAGISHSAALESLPSVTTAAPTVITPTSATLNGAVSPNGGSACASFVYGFEAGATSTTPAQTVAGSGASPVTANVSGLGAGAVYAVDHLVAAAGACGSGGPVVTSGDMPFLTPLPISPGWNLVAVPTTLDTGAASTLASGFSGALHGMFRALAILSSGRWQLYVPGYSPDFTLSFGQGIAVLSADSTTDNWTPGGSILTAGGSVPLQAGWNLAAPVRQPETPQQVCTDTGATEVVQATGGSLVPYICGITSGSGALIANAQSVYLLEPAARTWVQP